MRRAAAIAFVVALAACAKTRPVEAPIVDIPVGSWDAASARSLVTEAPPSAASARSEPGSIVGRWEGIGHQDDGQSWPIEVEIKTTKHGVCAEADYPSVPCRAEWLCIGELHGQMQAREKLVDDSARRCIDNGAMTLRVREDGLLEWTWSGQGQKAEAQLHRTK